jgi:general secretion pathway protein G
VYRVPGSKTDFDLYSLGKDGKPGGSGEDADIGLSTLTANNR